MDTNIPLHRTLRTPAGVTLDALFFVQGAAEQGRLGMQAVTVLDGWVVSAESFDIVHLPSGAVAMLHFAIMDPKTVSLDEVLRQHTWEMPLDRLRAAAAVFGGTLCHLSTATAVSVGRDEDGPYHPSWPAAVMFQLPE